MQGSAWITLFRHVPANLHESLGFLINTGAEIVVQRILRLESEFMLVRGRMSGSTDAARIIILPYNQVVNVSFNKRMTDEEAQKIFEKLGLDSYPATVSVAAAVENGAVPAAVQTGRVEFAPAPSSDSAEETDTVVEGAEEVAAESAQAVKVEEPPPAKSAPPSKSILLARLRARLAGEPKK